MWVVQSGSVVLVQSGIVWLSASNSQRKEAYVPAATHSDTHHRPIVQT